MLRRVARELHAIDGEPLAADQAFPIADREHRREHGRDIRAQRAHEVSDRGEVRLNVPRKGDERHVRLAGPLDRAAADDPLGVGDAHHLQ